MSFILLGILNAQAEAAGGIVSDYELIESQTLSSNAASVSFDVTGLGSTYQHLQLRITARTTQSGQTSALRLRTNGSNLLTPHILYGTGSSVSHERSTSSLIMCWVNGAGSPTGAFSNSIIDINDAFLSGKTRAVRALSGAIGSSISRAQVAGSNTFNTDALTELTLLDYAGDNLVAGSNFALYGWKVA